MGTHKICTTVNKRALHQYARCDRTWAAVCRFSPSTEGVPTRAICADVEANSQRGRRSRIKPGAAYGSGRLQRPAVRTAFRSFTGRKKGFRNCSENLSGDHFRRHFPAEKTLLASTLPESPPFQGVGAMSVLLSKAFQGHSWQSGKGDPQIKTWRNL